jgi:ribonucleotide reductase beta subunit family protein with ferritin-like domain
MKIDLQIDSTQMVLRLKNGERRLAYAAVNAINNTAKRIQAVERDRVEQVFTVRKKDFMRREAAVIKPFASVKQGRAFAEIAAGQKPRLLLSMFERGGERGPFTPGAKNVAIPVKGSPARPTFRSEVPEALTFKKLRFRKTRAIGTTPTGKAKRSKKKTSGIWFGEQGTYMIPGVGVFQRKTSERVRRLLYSFKPSVHLNTRLHFVQTAEKEAQRWFHEEMEREVINAIARARGAGL